MSDIPPHTLPLASNIDHCVFNMTPFQNPADVLSNERSIQDDYLIFSMDNFPSKSLSIEPFIDPSLRADGDDDGSQQPWSITLEPSPLQQPYDVSQAGDVMIPRGLACPSNVYGACEPSFSHQSSPGYSFTASPSLRSEPCVPQGPATPPDAHVPVFSLYDPAGVDYSHQVPLLDSPGACLGRPAISSSYLDAAISNSYHNYQHQRQQQQQHQRHHHSMSPNRRAAMGVTLDGDGGSTMGRLVTRLGGEAEEVQISGKTQAARTTTPLEGTSASCLRNRLSRSSSNNNDNKGLASRKRKYSSPQPPRSTPDTRYCQRCKLGFETAKQLEDHSKAKHARPFLCVFHFAGCPARFEAKNEWKRHVATKHVSLRYWLCLEGNCSQSRGSTTHSRSRMLPPLGSIFNRKDLYTQHVRRMHPEAAGLSGSSQGTADERLKKMQEAAVHKRLELPQAMKCPVPECAMQLSGPGAWNEWMEHIAQKHFDCSSPAYKTDVGFGGPGNAALTSWAERDDVQIVRRTSWGWHLCEPLKGDNDCMRSPGETMDGL